MNENIKAIKITEKVYWVGAIDASLREFHGYYTPRGTTYNAFLILGSEPVLIDTVKKPFYGEMMARISSVIDPKQIRYIISNHSEMDHSGCLTGAISAIKPEKVFASKMGIKALNAHFHNDFEFVSVENGGEMILGDSRFRFFETRMLHWPDSMFTFFENDGVLFSQDAFGMHLAFENILAKDNDRTIMQDEASKYFANILLPYAPLVKKLLKELPEFHLDIKLIAPDHGPLYSTSEDIKWIIKLWAQWAEQKRYKKAVIVYATMWGSTEKMAKAIAKGIKSEEIEAKLMPLSTSNRSDIITELLEAGALIIGSPTFNQQIFPTVADVLCYLKGLKRQNLIGQVFGSYGWGGEAVKLMQEELQQMKITLIDELVSIQYVPTEEQLSLCYNLGVHIAKSLKKES